MLDVEYIIRNMMKRFGIEDLIKSDEEEEEKIFETSNFFCFGVEDITCECEEDVEIVQFLLVLKTLCLTKIGLKKVFEPSNFFCSRVEDITCGVKKMFKPSNFSWFGVEDIMSGGFDLD